jgi:hypothetical protein
MFKKVLFIVALMSFVASVSGTYYYDNNTGDGLYTTANNWASASITDTARTHGWYPAATDRGYVCGGVNPGEDVKMVVQAADNVVNARMRAGFTGSTAAPSLQGTCTVEIYGSLDVSASGTTYAQNTDASFLIDGGSLTTAGAVCYNGACVVDILNGGVVDTSGGDLTLSYPFASGAGYFDMINIDDGQFVAGGVTTGDPMYLFLGIDIKIGPAGQLIIGGGFAEFLELKQLEADGLLYGAGGSALQYIWDGVNETTTVQLPEPATIALLGLGGLLLRKRR